MSHLSENMGFTERLMPCKMRERSRCVVIGNSLKRMAFALCIAWVLGIVVVPTGFAVPGSTHILVLDREPFYSPPTWRVRVGQTVQWHNRSMQSHTITHDGCGQRVGCAFHSGHLHPGKQFVVRDLEPGTYPYHCNLHPFMRGVIVVDPPPSRNFNTTEL